MPNPTQPSALPAPALAGRPVSRSWIRFSEGAINGSLALCGVFSVVTTFLIIVVLAGETLDFFRMPEVSLREFFFTTVWAPLLGADKHFGIWPLICGTVLVAGVAATFALPFGLITAIYLSEYAPRKLRAVLKPVLEILAGVPTVVYGFFALIVLTPALKGIFGPLEALRPLLDLMPAGLADFLTQNVDSYNALSAGLAVGIMTLPIVCSLSEDALQAVPRSLREGAYAVGATKFDVSTKVVLPAALSGVVAAFLLAIARAVGETMIVALAAGGLAQMTADPRDQVQTITGYMVQIFLGDAPTGGVEYKSSYAVAAVLFVMTFALTLLGHRVLVKFREVYE